MFKKLFNKKEVKYFAGWEVNFKNKSDLTKFMLNHAVTKRGFDTVKQLQNSITIEIVSNKIVAAYNHEKTETGFTKEKIVEDIELPLLNLKEHEVFFLEKDPKGNHIIGGHKPKYFNLPYHKKLKTAFQFIASIDTKDKFFNWINLDRLNIAYPMLEYVHGLFLDYTDSNNPKLLNPEAISGDIYTPEVAKEKDVEFKETHFKCTSIFSRRHEFNDPYLCGVPIWLQAPQYPVCPKTGELMKFVCTICSDSEIPVVNNSTVKNHLFKYLNFGDYGYLYVFYHPKSKILYLDFQTT